jgi:hypothetical protein
MLWQPSTGLRAKAHVYSAKELGVTGKEDARVIERAFAKKCLIVTVNKDFVDYYRNHPLRKAKNGQFFYGLIFLKPSRQLARKKQLQIALADIAWRDTREHDDLIRVSASGRTRHERLCHPSLPLSSRRRKPNGASGLFLSDYPVRLSLTFS